MSIAVAAIRPLSRLATPADAVRFFTPNWFAATMGTGILAIALGQFPDLPLLFAAGTGLWLFNVALFTLFTALYATRWITHFSGAKRILAHSSMSMSLGCIPMGLATIINGAVLFGIPAFGTAIVPIAHALWWLDAALALACGIGVPFMMFTRQSHSPQQMTAIWLLPIVAAEVTAASGGLLLPHLGPADQLTVTLLSYCLWACSVPLALGMLVVLVVRMIVHNLPDANMASSCWLALGPIATGALGMLLLAEHAPPGARDQWPWRLCRCGGWRQLPHCRAALGLWNMVAGHGGPDHPALFPRRCAVQPGLVGLHLPAGRLCRHHAQARPYRAVRPAHGVRQRAGRRPGAGLAHRRLAHPLRRMARRAVLGAVLGQ